MNSYTAPAFDPSTGHIVTLERKDIRYSIDKMSGPESTYLTMTIEPVVEVVW